jgi:hypothetical protein
MTSSRRTTNSQRYLMKAESNKIVDALCEMDSHADTCVLGPNFRILHYTGRVCDVTPYSEEYAPAKDIPIVCAATVYQSPTTGAEFIVFWS